MIVRQDRPVAEPILLGDNDLGVSRHAPVDDIVAAVSRATGRDLATVYALLAGPLPVDDDGLVAFATDLSTLEEEVRPVL